MVFAKVLGERLLAWTVGLCVLGLPPQSQQALPY